MLLAVGGWLFVTRSRSPAPLPGEAGALSALATNQAFGNTGDAKLQLLGDSITVQSTPEINDRFGDSYDVAIAATVGADTALQAAKVPPMAALGPAVAVINLGTNDARLITAAGIDAGARLAAVTRRLDEFAAAFPPGTCVVFITVNSHNPSWGPDAARAINEHIRASFGPVADWDQAWNASSFDAPDDPHPSRAGRRALVELVADTIDHCPQPSRP